MTELSLQCDLAERAASRLEKARIGWLREAPREHWNKPTPPINIVEDCHLLLLAAGIVSKILFGTSPLSKARGARLRELMNLPDLPILSDRAVRNSYEHIDERLDALSDQFPSGVSICPLMVDEDEPAPNTIVLKRFCPRTMRVYFGDQYVELDQLIEELKTIRAGIYTADSALDGVREKLL